MDLQPILRHTPGLEALWLRQMRAYTQGDHDSLLMETALSLLQSLHFTLSLGQGEELTGRLTQGQAQLQSLLHHAQFLLARVRATAPALENQSYHETLAALPSFFRAYDPIFFAHEVPADIDYQLCLPVPESLLGVQYVIRYLEHLLIENRFLNAFPLERVKALLSVCCPDYRGLHINLYAPAFENALGCVLLQKPPQLLDISPEENRLLTERLSALAPKRLPALLESAARNLCLLLSIERTEDAAYAQQAAKALSPRLRTALQAGRLEAFFFSLDSPKQDAHPAFVEGERMTEEEMSALVKALRDGKPVDEKVALVRDSVRSLQDLYDLLSTCFWQDEYPFVFALLTPAERKALCEIAAGEAPEWLEALQEP